MGISLQRKGTPVEEPSVAMRETQSPPALAMFESMLTNQTVSAAPEIQEPLDERRSFARKPLPWVVLVFFSQSHWGKLIDLNEKGMSFEFDRSPALKKPIEFTFEAMGAIPSSEEGTIFSSSFQAIGQVLWTREFERVAGVQFLNVQEKSLEQIRQWMAWDTFRTAAMVNGKPPCESHVITAPAVPPEDEASFDSETSKALAHNEDHDSPTANPLGKDPWKSKQELVDQKLPSASFGRSKRPCPVKSQGRAGMSLFHVRWGGLAILAAVMCCLSLLAGVKVARSLTGGFTAVKSVSTPPADKDIPSQVGKVPVMETAHPFQVEVQDVESHRWLLFLGAEHYQDSSTPTVHVSASSAAAVSSKKEEETKVPAAVAGEIAHSFNLISPTTGGPKTMARDASLALPPAPVLFGETPGAPELPLPNIVASRAVPVPAERSGRLGGDVQPARLIRAVPPVYPEVAKATQVGGDVTLEALIDSAGNVTAVKAISGPDLLYNAARKALKQWKYEPALLNGLPTATRLTVTMKFRVR